MSPLPPVPPPNLPPGRVIDLPGRGEVFVNATDVFNTLRIKKAIYGDGFHFVSTDYYETQVFRVGYTYKF